MPKAAIIPLPGAALAPVQNERRPGRKPAGVPYLPAERGRRQLRVLATPSTDRVASGGDTSDQADAQWFTTGFNIAVDLAMDRYRHGVQDEVTANLRIAKHWRERLTWSTEKLAEDAREQAQRMARVHEHIAKEIAARGR